MGMKMPKKFQITLEGYAFERCLRECLFLDTCGTCNKYDPETGECTATQAELDAINKDLESRYRNDEHLLFYKEPEPINMKVKNDGTNQQSCI